MTSATNSITQPVVSVAVVTYNHVRYIRRAIEGALAQQVNFPYEIIVGDDASTDGAREILLEMQRQSPDRLTLLLPEQNLGMMPNYVQVLNACRGKYIALLEGDDFWTSEHKLQLQKDALDAHPDVAICHHNADRWIEGDPAPAQPWHPRRHPRWQSLRDLMRKNIILTSTCMYRAGLFGPLPEWFTQAATADWPIHVMNAQHGRILYLDRNMAAYRLHPESVWSSTARTHQVQGIIRNAELVRPLLAPAHQRRLDRTIEIWRQEILECLWRDGRKEEAEQRAQQEHREAGFRRTQLFFESLDDEERGAHGAAVNKLLRAAVTGRGQTRLTDRDVAIALIRNLSPGPYRTLRSLWRRWAG